jgi:hypothetical protein
MTLKDTLRKMLAMVMAACFTALAGAAFAGSDKPGEQKVDCKQTPNHPDCRGKTQ